MSTISSNKRNRSDNYDSNDIGLFVNLLSEHPDVDSTKLDARKQAWETITAKFNANCTGVKRDINSLKMKMKNMKAQAKKPKLEHPEEDEVTEIHIISANSKLDDDNEDEFNETDANMSHSEQSSTKTRKRCKKFSQVEVDLLCRLYEKYCQGLDSSCSSNSIKRRNEAWSTLTDDFNQQQTSGIRRDESELKIKIKNIKATKVRTETSSTEPSSVANSNANISLTPIKIIEDRKPLQHQHLSSTPAPAAATTAAVGGGGGEKGARATRSNNIDVITESLYGVEDEFDEYIQPMPMDKDDDDKELMRVRRDNILLQNSVLRKKERLLELQIALAERSLRRQI